MALCLAGEGAGASQQRGFNQAILTAFGVFFGLLGLFLALPLIVVARIWLKEVLIRDVLDQWRSPKRHNSQVS